jgi:hypothetical protein
VVGHTSAKMTLDTYADLFDDDLDCVADTCTAGITLKCRKRVGRQLPDNGRRNSRLAASIRT